MNEKCSKEIRSGSRGFDRFRFRPCGRPGKIEFDGKWYCGVHDPIKQTAKQDAKWRARQSMEATLAQESAEQARKLALWPEIVAALEHADHTIQKLSTGGCRDVPETLAEIASALVKMRG